MTLLRRIVVAHQNALKKVISDVRHRDPTRLHIAADVAAIGAVGTTVGFGIILVIALLAALAVLVYT